MKIYIKIEHQFFDNTNTFTCKPYLINCRDLEDAVIWLKNLGCVHQPDTGSFELDINEREYLIATIFDFDSLWLVEKEEVENLIKNHK
jgi:hypothetical protein